MDGNHSLLAIVPFPLPCEDVQAALIINIILGFPVNMCVMWIILASSGGIAAEIFSLNQSICELAICMANVITFFVMNSPRSNVSIYLWYIIRFFWGFIFSGRSLFMSLVCLERYLAVVHPVTFLKYKLSRCRLAGAVLSWLKVLVCCIILLLVPLQAVHYLSFAMVFPGFLVQIFLCVETLRALVRPVPGDGSKAGTGMNTAKLKAFRIKFVFLLTVSFAYLPYIISITLQQFVSEETSSKMFCISIYSVLVTGFVPPLHFIYRAGVFTQCTKVTA